jgi:hypothetical protein
VRSIDNTVNRLAQFTHRAANEAGYLRELQLMFIWELLNKSASTCKFPVLKQIWQINRGMVCINIASPLVDPATSITPLRRHRRDTKFDTLAGRDMTTGRVDLATANKDQAHGHLRRERANTRQHGRH